jgi:hypothetical protein
LDAIRPGLLAAVAAVSIANVVSNAHRLPPQRGALPSAANPPVRQEQRFGPMRGELESRGVAGTIGYLCDIPNDGVLAAERIREDYYLAQFSLAPVVLDASAAPHDWAIASLHGYLAKEHYSGDWKIAVDQGDGVLLLRRAGP